MIEELEMRVQALEARVATMARQQTVPTPTVGAVATDGELDSPYGNPEIRKDPPRWSGKSYVGSRMSDCPADYLENLAGFKDWQARKQEEANEVDAKGRPRSDWSRKDAKLARGWARRSSGG